MTRYALRRRSNQVHDHSNARYHPTTPNMVLRHEEISVTSVQGGGDHSRVSMAPICNDVRSRENVWRASLLRSNCQDSAETAPRITLYRELPPQRPFNPIPQRFIALLILRILILWGPILRILNPSSNSVLGRSQHECHYQGCFLSHRGITHRQNHNKLSSASEACTTQPATVRRMRCSIAKAS